MLNVKSGGWKKGQRDRVTERIEDMEEIKN
jgi:hypothetical protein